MAKLRNPGNPQRFIEANERKTQKQIETYYGKEALRATWEMQSIEVQQENHGYIIGLHKRIRNVRNYLLHRANANADV